MILDRIDQIAESIIIFQIFAEIDVWIISGICVDREIIHIRFRFKILELDPGDFLPFDNSDAHIIQRFCICAGF